MTSTRGRDHYAVAGGPVSTQHHRPGSSAQTRRADWQARRTEMQSGPPFGGPL